MDINFTTNKTTRIVSLFVLMILIEFFWFSNQILVLAASVSTYLFSYFLYLLFRKLFKDGAFNLTSEKKSIPGLAAFSIGIVISLSVFTDIIGRTSPFGFEWVIRFDDYFILGALLISIVLTAFQAMSSNGFDKLIVPLVSSIMIFVFFKSPDSQLLFDFFLGMVFAGAIAFLSYKVKFLTANGSIATFLLAGFIFGFGGLQWSIPMLTFFILSSLLSKVRKKQNEKIEQYFEKSGVRDYMQVLANGGIGGILVILDLIFPHDIYFVAYIASLAAVCADTWATEIGTMVKTDTYNILNFKRVEQGISGGISIIGTLGACCGALVIAISGIFWIDDFVFNYFLIVILAGVLGSFFDSFLGATIQSQNKCNVCSKITERDFHCGEKAIHFRGYKWINNDMVNLFAGLTGSLFIIIVYGLL